MPEKESSVGFYRGEAHELTCNLIDFSNQAFAELGQSGSSHDINPQIAITHFDWSLESSGLTRMLTHAMHMSAGRADTASHELSALL